MEGAAFCFYWNTYSGYGLAFIECSASAKLSSIDLQNALWTVMLFT